MTFLQMLLECLFCLRSGEIKKGFYLPFHRYLLIANRTLNNSILDQHWMSDCSRTRHIPICHNLRHAVTLCRCVKIQTAPLPLDGQGF